jgi:hypothetical protein
VQIAKRSFRPNTSTREKASPYTLEKEVSTDTSTDGIKKHTLDHMVVRNVPSALLSELTLRDTKLHISQKHLSPTAAFLIVSLRAPHEKTT